MQLCESGELGVPPRRRRVLIATRDDASLRLLSEILEETGYDVTTARDGGELLEAAASTLLDGARAHIDLVIAEHRLLGLGGLTALASIRRYGRRTKFILITRPGERGIETRARGLEASVLPQSSLDLSFVEARAGLRRLLAGLGEPKDRQDPR